MRNLPREWGGEVSNVLFWHLHVSHNSVFSSWYTIWHTIETRMVVCCLAVLQIYLCLYLLFILQENYKVLINFWEVILKNFDDSLQKKSEVLYASLVRSTGKVSRHSSQFMHFFFLKNTLLCCQNHLKLCTSLLFLVSINNLPSSSTTSLKDLKPKYRDILAVSFSK